MNNLNAAFYTEAGKKRGLGHLIRSYTIYEKFKSLNVKSSFFLDSDIDFTHKFGDIKYFKWSELNTVSGYDIIFIDSYEADISLYEEISKSCRLAVFIDDYSRLDYPKGVILNFLPGANKLFFKQKKEKNTYLLGPEYIPTREQFLNSTPVKQNQIFIMLGGTDIANLSLNILDCLKDIDTKKVIVVNNKSVAEKLSKNQDAHVLFQPTDKELAKNMANSSLAIATASMSLYELAYFKIPAIILTVAKNQEIGAKQLIKYHFALKSISIEDKFLENKVKKEATKQYLKNNLIINESIDGQGAQRIFNNVMEMINK